MWQKSLKIESIFPFDSKHLLCHFKNHLKSSETEECSYYVLKILVNLSLNVLKENAFLRKKCNEVEFAAGRKYFAEFVNLRH